MRVRFICGCGGYNYCWEDWISHWKYGNRGKLHALWLLLTTKIEVVK